jgi:hypothetical protein
VVCNEAPGGISGLQARRWRGCWSSQPSPLSHRLSSAIFQRDRTGLPLIHFGALIIAFAKTDKGVKQRNFITWKRIEISGKQQALDRFRVFDVAARPC